jgi:hypothetical protein
MCMQSDFKTIEAPQHEPGTYICSTAVVRDAETSGAHQVSF